MILTLTECILFICLIVVVVEGSNTRRRLKNLEKNVWDVVDILKKSW